MISGINHITLSVKDLDKAFYFYSQVLGFRALAKRKSKSAYFLAGEDWIALVQSKVGDTQSKSYTHLAFTISNLDFESMSKRIRDSGAIIWQENTSPGQSLYFLDPSGNQLEIHSGSWKSRIQWLRDHPSDEFELFD